jgi:hypothetical protein
MEQYTLNKEQLESIMYGYAAHIEQYGKNGMSPSDWFSRYGPATPSPQDVPVGPWSFKVEPNCTDTQNGYECDEYVTLSDGKVTLYVDCDEEDTAGEIALCEVLNKYGIKLDYDHEAEFVADFLEKELKRVQEAQAGVLRPIKPLGDWLLAQKDLPPVMLPDGGYWYYGSVLQLLKRYLKESASPSLPAKEQAVDPVDFALWFTRNVSVYGDMYAIGDKLYHGPQLPILYTQSLTNAQP